MIALAAIALLQSAAPATAATAESEIRAQRAAFNRAIAGNDIAGIAAVLADNVQMITGTDSKLVAGKQPQLDLWAGDPRGVDRVVYVRTPNSITASPLLPIAMEHGHWRGAPVGAAKDWVGGHYTAKWRRIDGDWRIEIETYMTTGCGGALCPKAK